MRRLISSIAISVALCLAAGCESTSSYSPYEPVTTYRTPADMENDFANVPRPTAPPPSAPILTNQTTGDRPQVPLRRSLPDPTAETPDPQTPAPTPSDIIRGAQGPATQGPSEGHFINAVQIYEFVPGAIYEVFAAPGYVTMLYLEPGEELRHLVAGDTTRWLVDVVAAGHADSGSSKLFPRDQQPPAERVSILVKPRFPELHTNLNIATDKRVYLIDVKSCENTYHSAVAWAYPESPTVFSAPTESSRPAPPVRETGIRNYLYTLKAPPNGLPPWAPKAVYDDGHRVYVEFDPSIDDHERPPLYLLDADGMARMVNYRTESNFYVVDQLFDRAALRIGSERVVIERVRPRPSAFPDVPRIEYVKKE